MPKYTVGGSGTPGKPKKTKRANMQAMSDYEKGQQSKKEREERFNTPKEKRKIADLMDVNTKSGKLLKEGKLELNDHGIPKGGSAFRNLQRKRMPKFRSGGE